MEYSADVRALVQRKIAEMRRKSAMSNATLVLLSFMLIVQLSTILASKGMVDKITDAVAKTMHLK